MQGMRDQRLAGAGFAVDQHMAVSLAQIQDILAQPLQRRAGTDQLFHDRAAVRQFFAQRAVVQGQAARLGGLFGQFSHPVRVKGLFQKVERPDPHRLNRHRHIAVAGDHDDRQARIHPHQAFQKGHAIHTGHLDVTDHHAGELRPDHLQRLFGTRIGFGVKARQGQPLADRGPHVRLVIDDRHLHCPCHAALIILLP